MQRMIRRGRRIVSYAPRTLSTARASLALLAGLAASTYAHAQAPTADSVAPRAISPGVTLSRITNASGPFVMHVLAVDLHRRELSVGAARACDQLTGRERPSAIARRLRAGGTDVVAVLNAGFFDLVGGSGTSESNLVIDGELVKGVEITESPFDRYDNVHTQFGMTAGGKPVIDRFALRGSVRTAKHRWVLGAVNGEPVADEVSLYTEWTTLRPRFPATARAASVLLSRIGYKGDTARFRVADNVFDARADSNPSHRLMLVGSGRAASDVAALRAGDIVRVVSRFTPDRGSIASLVGGWPRIVRDGMNVAALADSVEGTKPGFSKARHPRSAVGISKDSATLYLVAVDGRQAWSVGMSLDELASAMIALGAYQALNLDGGGSTSLVVGDSVVNTPSDPTGERAVGDVIIVTRRDTTAPTRRRTLPADSKYATCITSGARDPDSQPAVRPK
jgi:hypothetical protein